MTHNSCRYCSSDDVALHPYDPTTCIDVTCPLQQVVTGSVLIPMVRLLANPVERCREGALSFLTSAAEQLPEPAALLSALLPAITDRMGDVPVLEPSEEQRLAIIKLIAGPVILRSGQGLLPYLNMIVKVVCRALEDSFHDIKKVGSCHVQHAYVAAQDT